MVCDLIRAGGRRRASRTFAWFPAAALALAPGAGAQTTRRVSVDSYGAQGDYGSDLPSISRDGRYVVHGSAATNLAPGGDQNGEQDVIRYDVRTGAVLLISVDSSGAQGDGPSISSAVSGDGRYVAFDSDATNLAAGDMNSARDVFLRDVLSGTTTLVSRAFSAARSANDWSSQPSITPDGRFVTFYSAASNLVAWDGNGAVDAFRFDATTGRMDLVSLGLAGNQGDDDSYESWTFRGPGISDDGRFVAFPSLATNLVGGSSILLRFQVFVRDTRLGTTRRASENAAGTEGNLSSASPSISADGRWVAFASDANNLVQNDTSPFDAFVKDLRTGAVERVSVRTGGDQGGGGGQALYPSLTPWIGADGRFVTFGSKYSNLVPGDTNGVFDIFRHDRWLVRTERLSLDSGGIQADGMSAHPVTSQDGRLSVFVSLATNLVPGDSNGAADVFVRSLPVAYTAFCSGDGTPGTTPCPCGNPGSFGHGCENSGGSGGGAFFAEGTARVGADTLTLHAARIQPHARAYFLQGTGQSQAGAGAPFGDGLGCLSGARIRLGNRTASATGLVSFGAGVSGDPPVSAAGAIPAGGGMRTYQVLYRDRASFCTPSTLNSTHGISVVWTP